MATKSKQVDLKVDKAEYNLSDGTSVVWIRDHRWSVTIYKHSHQPRYISTVAHLPSILNAIFFAKKYPLEKILY